ncbi:MAG TPA: hypothetical protein VMF03_17125 [Steroidobacteraceae bacterium]|nr:hypothetical protein [Steroidobacteraceae bacterium]
MKKVIIAAMSATLVTTVALAYEIHHPNLRDAHHEAENAIHHIEAAQKNNIGHEFGGHAEKAIDLLRHAQEELDEADRYNDAHHR